MSRSLQAFLALAFCVIATLPAFAANQSPRPPLIPQPREFEPQPDLSLASGVSILVPGRDAEDRFAADDLAAEFKQRGIPSKQTATTLRIYLIRDSSPLAQRILARHHLAFDEPMRAEGYILITETHEAFVIAHTAEGVFYGAQTLKQLIRTNTSEPALLGCAIRDWPAMRYRGVDDDLSRGPVPTLDFQKKQIRTFAAYKINI